MTFIAKYLTQSFLTTRLVRAIGSYVLVLSATRIVQSEYNVFASHLYYYGLFAVLFEANSALVIIDIPNKDKFGVLSGFYTLLYVVILSFQILIREHLSSEVFIGTFLAFSMGLMSTLRFVYDRKKKFSSILLIEVLAFVLISILLFARIVPNEYQSVLLYGLFGPVILIVNLRRLIAVRMEIFSKVFMKVYFSKLGLIFSGSLLSNSVLLACDYIDNQTLLGLFIFSKTVAFRPISFGLASLTQWQLIERYKEMKGIALKSIFLAVAALCIMLFLEDQIWPREHILDESSLGWIFFFGMFTFMGPLYTELYKFGSTSYVLVINLLFSCFYFLGLVFAMNPIVLITISITHYIIMLLKRFTYEG